MEGMDAWPVLVMSLYALSAAALMLGGYVALSGRLPRIIWRNAARTPAAGTRAQGAGLLLIAGLVLTSTVAIDLGQHSLVRPYWVLLVWVGLLGGLLGIRYLTAPSESQPSPS